MTYYTNELYHHGIKGQKWGVRRYQNADGTLTAKGIKRYATKGYTQDAYNHNKTVIGKAYDKYTGAHKMAGKALYKVNSAPGESGWVGAGRAIKAKASEKMKQKNNASSRKGAKSFVAGHGSKIAYKALDKIGGDLYRKNASNASPRAIRAVQACGILSKTLKTYAGTNYYTGWNEIFGKRG